MDYQKLYDELIQKSKLRGLDKKALDYYTERHHIKPFSMFPELGNLKEHPENAVLLTAKEHFIAHYYLWKIYDNFEMRNAFAYFLVKQPIKEKQFGYDEAKLEIDAEEFALLREQQKDNWKRVNDILGPEGRKARTHKSSLTLGKEGYQEIRRKQIQTLGPKRLTEIKKLRDNNLGKEGLSKAAKKTAQTLGPEGCSARCKKRAETMGHEKMSESAKKICEKLGREKLIERSLKAAQTLGKEGRIKANLKGAETLRNNPEKLKERNRKIGESKTCNWFLRNRAKILTWFFKNNINIQTMKFMNNIEFKEVA